MADDAPGAGRELADPSHRGRTTVADRVIEKIARQAARSSSPVTSGRVLGSGLPVVSVTTAGERARVDARIAAPWGAPPSSTAARAARHIRESLEALTPLTVDVVEVAVAELVLATTPERRVR
ncbi:hypothetical protein C8046_12360 [Serinibacter arcticus]|uniref:Asp23/Gls24 family envelope stress response protein n=1 Tax=Serinibacter arcticus TaxID=1655435 RepID=A0A2U1ZWH1_9MICO|nr:Asp23/Gls24 family envelope stress response protein [Serinibacter arcticus]PWD51335.1 hypothetical protein C8046_12360 [Serinibacter arcticus]